MKFYYPDLVGSQGSVSSVYINHEKKFAFLELHTMEEAAAAMKLDQVHWRGQPLKVRRPMDYDASMWPVINVPEPAHGGVSGITNNNNHNNNSNNNTNANNPNYISSQVPDGPHKVFIGGLPYNLGEVEVKELLGAFGQLRAFHLVRDKENNQSKGYGYV